MPDQEQQSPLVPLVLERFAGCNTATTRQGVPDEQAYWFDGFVPLASRNARTLWGIGPALYTATGGETVVCFYFYNIGASPYVVLFLSDGSAIQVNTATAAATTVLPAGTIVNPSITGLGISQWASQYLLIAANQSNGYWVWDGLLLYGAGTLAPQVTLTDPGDAYQSVPVVTATGGNGYGATFVASIGDGVVSNVVMTNPGQGYLAGDSVSLVFTGGTLAGSGASVTAVMSHAAGGTGGSLTPVFAPYFEFGGESVYQLTGISLNAPGSGYDVNVVAGFNAAPAGSSWGSNTSSGLGPPGIVVTETGGAITSVVRAAYPSNPNYFYVTSTASPAFPTIAVSDTGYYYVSSVTGTPSGTDYSPGTSIAGSGGGSPQSQATFLPDITSGTLTSVAITSGGVYGSSSPPTLTVADSAVTATAVVRLMPYGVQGTALTAYQGHVWIFNGTLKQWSAPGSVSDFATADGGGSETSASSTQRVGYTGAVSTNGFLFEISDSSMDYVSGVQTSTPSGGSPTTTFNESNSDPEVGTPYPAAITTLGQDIFVANATGIFVSSGGAFVKISEAMDGVYNTVPAAGFNASPFSGFQLSAAKATIFGKRVWMVLVPIVDPVSGSQVNKLLMVREKKIWWASQQDVALTFIQGQEINSIYTAWGTDGTRLYPLFNRPSTGFTKLVQSKLWDEPGGYESDKADSRFWSLWDCASTSSTSLFVNIDSVLIDGTGAQVTNTQAYTLTGPGATGHFCTPPFAVGQQGILTGMTIMTAGADLTLVSAKIAAEIVGYRG